MQPETGNTRPWMEPAADKLLSDYPAMVAKGDAAKNMTPAATGESPDYNMGETDAEKRARLQGAALEFQIVREGVPFEFSKLSGVGDINVTYWKRKPLLMLQGIVALAVLVLLLLLGRMGRRMLLPVLGVVVCFAGASLADGFAARLWNPAFAASIAAFIVNIVALAVRQSREAKARTAAKEAAHQRAFDREYGIPLRGTTRHRAPDGAPEAEGTPPKTSSSDRDNNQQPPANA